MTNLPPSSPQFGGPPSPPGEPDPYSAVPYAQQSPQPVAQQPAPTAPQAPARPGPQALAQHPGQPTQPTSGSGRAPGLLVIAFISGVMVALPLVVFVVTMGVMNGDLDDWPLIGTLSAAVAAIAPVIGIGLGIHAGVTKRPPVSIGGWLVVVGSLLQIGFIVMATFLVDSDLIETAMMAIGLQFVGTLLPAILNLIGGILGLQRPRT